MVYKLEETPGVNNSKTYVLTHKRFITYLFLIFSNVNKAQIYKVPYRNNPHKEIEILMNFTYLNLFRSNEGIEGYHLRKPHDANFLFQIEDKEYIHVGQNVLTLETNDNSKLFFRTRF